MTGVPCSRPGCTGTIYFTTDSIGRVLERCGACGDTHPMAQQGVVRLLPCPNCGRYYPNPDRRKTAQQCDDCRRTRVNERTRGVKRARAKSQRQHGPNIYVGRRGKAQ